jgi:DNA polymerase-1
MKQDRLVLIDGHSLLFRAFYAMPPLTTKTGELVNAVYGFTSILLGVIEELTPTYIAVTFDSEGPTFRKTAFEAYKAQRKATPEELIGQIGRSQEMVRALNIPLFELQGFEADDLIGTLATQASNSKDCDVEVIIVTGDQDIFQLVKDGKVHVYMPGRGSRESIIYNEEKVKDRMGVTVSQIPDYKGLAGDSSDNIPGVRGIGPKTAIMLLNRFGTVESMYEQLKKGNTDGIGKAVLNKLLDQEENALKSKKLATIVTEVPLQLDLPACKVAAYDKVKTMDLLNDLGFKSLMSRLPQDEFEQDIEATLF